MSTVPIAPTPTWLCVFETGGQRRRQDRPRVLVASKIVQPGPALEAMIERSKRLKKQHVTKVLYELMPKAHEPGGLKTPFIIPDQKDAIKRATTKLTRQLKAEGYTVGNDLTVWHLYAIELKPPKRPREQHRGYLYVGQTSLDVEERIKQHRLGPAYPWKDNKPKHSRPCHEGFVQPRLDLLPERFRQTLYSQESALVAESDLRRYFEGLGYKVKGGTERYKQRKKQK